MNIFSYDELREKARREIRRLTQAIDSLEPHAAVDHALNAAFTIYHLIEWAHDEGRLSKTSTRAYIKNTSNLGLKVLHDVVTRNKHVRVDSPAYDRTISPKLEDNVTYLATEDEQIMITEDGNRMVTENSNIAIYFGDQEAVSTLHDALSEFAQYDNPGEMTT